MPGGTTALGNGLKLLLLNGTAAKLAGNGIGFSTAEWLPSSMSARVAPSSATPAARISTRSTIALGSAARHARLLTGAVQALTTLSDPAHSATQPSSSTATPARNAAPGAVASGTGISVVALWSSPPADVYCLSSELGSFALACGPVVSNCDALGYMCHRLFEVGRPTAGRAVRGVRLY